MNHRIGLSLSPTRSGFGPLLFSGNLPQGLQAAKELGYTGVELSLLDSEEIDQEKLMNDLQGLGLEVYAIATGQTYVKDGHALYVAEAAHRRKAVERLEGHMAFAARLGCPVIIGGIRGKVDSRADEAQEQIQAGHDALQRCVEFAEKKGVLLLLEPINRYESNVINTVEEALTLMTEIGSPQLKLLPDTFHMNIEEASFLKSIVRAGSAIGYVHLADSNRLAPGWGHLDFLQILKALERAGYRGPLGVEILPRPNDYEAGRQAIYHLQTLEA